METHRVMRTYSERIGEFIEGLKYEGVPEDVVEKTKLHILDTLGVAIAASRLSSALIMVDLCKNWGGSPESTIIGSSDRVPAPNAALANGLMAHAIDFDDTHLAEPTHPSCVVIPAVLAAAEAREESGKAVIVSTVAGYEIGNRIAMAGGRLKEDSGNLTGIGFHATSVVGTAAAAVGASKVLGLSDDQIATAIGISCSQSSGLRQTLVEGTNSKQFHAGWAAHSGIMSALLAEKGFTAPRQIFEGGKGFYKSFIGEGRYQLDKLISGLSSVWETRKICLKLYPTGV